MDSSEFDLQPEFPQKEYIRSSGELSSISEQQNLLSSNDKFPIYSQPRRPYLAYLIISCTFNIVLFFTATVLSALLLNVKYRDPSLKVWTLAKDAVGYVVKPFRGAMFNKTEYMGFPTDETDKLWSDLYNFGTSAISKNEAKKLAIPTIPIPGTDRYLIQLDVWHQLHCLNDIRKILYPERFPDMSLEAGTVNGTINRNTDMFRHWDHCLDALRQALMCNADVSPISFHVNVPVNSGIFPRLATTHTCRDFGKLQDWARENAAGDFDIEITAQQAEKIISESGFDHSPVEDIEMLWPEFPGNKFFQHWREHSVEEIEN